MPETFQLFAQIKAAQQENGLRHDDFGRYRRYCTRRIHRLRGRLNFHHKPATTEPSLKNAFERRSFSCLLEESGEKWDVERYLSMVLFESERAWAHAMEIRQQILQPQKQVNHASNRRHSVVLKLRRAVQYAQALEKLCSDASLALDPRSTLEAQAYSAWLEGILLFEKNGCWQESLNKLVAARTILEKLAQSGNAEQESLCLARIEEIDPNIRYCAFNLNQSSHSIEDIIQLQLRSSANSDLEYIQRKLEILMNSSAETESSSKTLDWRGKKVPVKNEKVMVAILKGLESRKKFEAGTDSVEAVRLLDQELQVFAEAHHLAAEDVRNDQAKDAKNIVLRSVEGYCAVQKYRCQFFRAFYMARSVFRVLRNSCAPFQFFHLLDHGKENFDFPVPTNAKPLDLARLFHEMCQGLDALRLIDLFEDPIFQMEVTELEKITKACKCFFMAAQRLETQEYPEAYTLMKNGCEYMEQARLAAVPKPSGELVSIQQIIKVPSIYDALVNGFIAFKSSIASFAVLKERKLGNMCWPSEADFPPKANPVPVKPVFYDLAYSHLMDKIPVDELKARVEGSTGKGLIGSLLGGWWGRGSGSS